ncbi:MAG: hypothetical protein ACRD0C_20165 [Acidimicrobiia bacterium]
MDLDQIVRETGAPSDTARVLADTGLEGVAVLSDPPDRWRPLVDELCRTASQVVWGVWVLVVLALLLLLGALAAAAWRIIT